MFKNGFKCLVITKGQLRLALAFLLCLIIILITASATGAAQNKKLPIYCVDTPDKKIAISFDAAWGNEDTPVLIDILKQYDVKATFFLVGEWVDKYPESVKQIFDAGHDIGNHSDTHPYLSKCSSEQMTAQITRCNEKIKSITGKTPTLLRPPYGDYNNAVVTAIENQNMYCIQWSVDSLDWKDSATAESIYNRVVGKVCPGSIVLFHNAAKHTPEALPNILKTLKDDGYEFVLIKDLIYTEDYKIDNSGKQIKSDGQ